MIVPFIGVKYLHAKFKFLKMSATTRPSHQRIWMWSWNDYSALMHLSDLVDKADNKSLHILLLIDFTLPAFDVLA